MYNKHWNYKISLEIIYVVLVMTQKHKSFLGHNGLKFMFHCYNTHTQASISSYFCWLFLMVGWLVVRFRFYSVYFLKATCFYTFNL